MSVFYYFIIAFFVFLVQSSSPIMMSRRNEGMPNRIPTAMPERVTRDKVSLV